MIKALSSSILIASAIMLAACGTTTKSVRGYQPSVETQALSIDESAHPTLVYKRSGAPGLDAYDRFIIDPVRVDYSDPDIQELNPEQLNEMQRKLQAAMISELSAAGYGVGTRSAPGTMRISMTIANLKAPSSLLNVSRAFLPFSMSVGEVTVEAVFRESTTNRIDAVVVNRAQGNRIASSKPWNTWADAEQSFKEWAVGVRQAVDQAHGK